MYFSANSLVFLYQILRSLRSLGLSTGSFPSNKPWFPLPNLCFSEIIVPLPNLCLLAESLYLLLSFFLPTKVCVSLGSQTCQPHLCFSVSLVSLPHLCLSATFLSLSQVIVSLPSLCLSVVFVSLPKSFSLRSLCLSAKSLSPC